RDQVLVLLLVGAGRWTPEPPAVAALGLDPIGAVAPALGADHGLAHDVLAAIDLAALAEDGDPARVLELDGEVVVDVSLAVALAHLAAAQPRDGAHRVRPQHPVHDVEIMHVLLDDVVAGEPGEVVPVADLPLQVT